MRPMNRPEGGVHPIRGGNLERSDVLLFPGQGQVAYPGRSGSSAIWRSSRHSGVEQPADRGVIVPRVVVGQPRSNAVAWKLNRVSG